MADEKRHLQRTARAIARRLHEHDPIERMRIGRIVACLGVERTWDLLNETLQIEQTGGMPTRDGQRRRSSGGVFFFCVRGVLEQEKRYPERHYIWPELLSPSAPSLPTASQLPSPPESSPLAALDIVLPTPGEARIVKVTLIGRPGTVTDCGTHVLVSMQPMKVPRLPKGVPPPPAISTYIVAVATKQWNHVAGDLATDPDDEVIVEGYGGHEETDPPGIVRISALSVISRKHQRQQREKPPPASRKNA